MCAMRGRRSVATTMGFTALEGLPMGTRTGAIDPGVILHLMSERRMSLAAVTELLYKQSGLLGMSGVSSDVRELLASASPRAARALDVFVYRVGRELGSLAAALGGLDALVFTAGSVSTQRRSAPVSAGVPRGSASTWTRRPTTATARASARLRAAPRRG
jgi:acetate kinase